MNQLPDLRGFKLDMPLEQIWERFPGMPKDVGAQSVVLSITSEKPIEQLSSAIHVNPLDHPDLQDVAQIHIGIIDKKVCSFTISYIYTNDDSFSSLLLVKVKESLKLNGEWVRASGKGLEERFYGNSFYAENYVKSVDISEISCSGFKVYAGQNKVSRRGESDATYYPFVQLIDTEAINKSKIREEEERKKHEAAREDEENKRRKEFKP